MPGALDYTEILRLFTDGELEEEYDWHRARGKQKRRAGAYGLYWWHQRHATMIIDEIRRRAELLEQAKRYTQLELVPRPGWEDR